MPDTNIDDKIKNLQIDGRKKSIAIRRKSSKKIWVIGLIVILVIIYSMRGMFISPEVEVGKAIKMDPPKMGDTVLTVSGYVIPNHRIEMAPKIIGRVIWIGVDKGDFVKKGQEIVRIENTEYLAQVNGAKGRLASAKAKLAELKTGARSEEINMAKSALRESESKYQNSQSNFKRIEKLFKQGAMSQESFDNASTQLVVAKEQLDSARENYDMVKTGPRKELIDAAQAEVNSAEASLQFVESQLSDTVIKAPADGTILERLIEVGEIVTNTSYGGSRGARTALLSMADLKDIQVEIDINESDIHKVHMHQPATISLESYPDNSYKGEVVEVAPEANRQKATIQVKVQFKNTDEKVKPEMNAKVSFLNDAPPTDSNSKSKIYVPARAITTQNGESFIFVIDNNLIKKTKITKGKDSEFGIEVTDGLVGNEIIAVSDQDTLKNGARIRVKKS